MSAPVFADSSAVVKLYADEPGSDLVRAVDAIVVSVLARVEVPAALWRKHRIGELSATSAGVLVAEFEADYFGDSHEPGRFAAVAAAPTVLDDAARLAARHGLRAYDAVQLASACATHEAAHEHIGFIAFDRDLLAAAAAEGLHVLSGD